MLHGLITQREGQNMYGKTTDVLEAAYTEFYESLGIRLHPVSNFTRILRQYLMSSLMCLLLRGEEHSIRDTMWSLIMPSFSPTGMRWRRSL